MSNQTVDWPEKRFANYLAETKQQLGELWTISDDASSATCGNLRLVWLSDKLTWSLRTYESEIDRFLLPFSDTSLARFHRTCSAHYQSNNV